MGGEKQTFWKALATSLGSPPRRRGKVPVLLMLLVYIGITPAWAGKSAVCHYSSSLSRDHPRVGGEKSRVMVLPSCRMGSPPRRRGKVDVLFGGLVDGRITPAQAGKSSVPFLRSAPRKDHPCAGGKSPLPGWTGNGSRDYPRAGGEKCQPGCSWCSGSGSPPHRRGKGAGQSGNTAKSRITPALAGKSHRYALLCGCA